MRVHLGGHLSWYDPGKRSRFEYRLSGPMPLHELLQKLGLPQAEIAVAAVNGEAVEVASAMVTDKDRLDLLPPVGGGAGRPYSIPYGRTALAFSIPDQYDVQWLAPAAIPPPPDPLALVADALDHPVGCVSLADFWGVKSAAIAINDKTRPVRLDLLLPPLLERLAALGIADGAITFLIATGTHTPMSPAEFAQVIPPDVLSRYRVLCHNIADQGALVRMGETSRGTPIWINRTFAEAELRLVVGNLEPHQFMGYSGGVKTAAIGLAARETIDRNHSLLLDPRSSIARYDSNPMRMEVEQIGERIGVHFVLNAVANENKEIVNVIAGDPKAVMREGILCVDALYRVEVEEPLDLAITSPGGYPKDINLYQGQKALAHAALITRRGGTIILAAACEEGTGSRAYEEWVIGMASHEAVMERFAREGFRIGPHKAFQLARDALRERVLFVTDMERDFVAQLLLDYCPTIDRALDVALRDLAPGSRIGILPYANATIPQLRPAV